MTFPGDVVHMDDVMAQNRSGRWVPAIPEPFFIGRKKCRCIRCPLVLKDRTRYREHYALQHVLDMD